MAKKYQPTAPTLKNNSEGRKIGRPSPMGGVAISNPCIVDAFGNVQSIIYGTSTGTIGATVGQIKAPKPKSSSPAK